MLQYKLQATKKLAAIDCSDSPSKEKEEDEVKTELEGIEKVLFAREYDLYMAKSFLPREPFRMDYDKLRENPKWYMRDELAQECSDRGGCCSRTCNCCNHKSERSTGVSGKKSATYGHCTVECWCCTNNRGFELTEEMKQKIRDDYKERKLDDWWRFVLSVANNHFVPP